MNATKTTKTMRALLNTAVRELTIAREASENHYQGRGAQGR